jgi:hypothetical protein
MRKTDYDQRLLPRIIEQGGRAGFSPAEHLPVLCFVPFVQIAWAEGFVQPAERRAILRLAESLNVAPEQPGYRELVGWLDERPPDEFFDRAGEMIRELLAVLPDESASQLRHILLFGCLEVAQAAGDIGLLRQRSGIRREEREQLRRIGEKLGLTPPLTAAAPPTLSHLSTSPPLSVEAQARLQAV